MNTVIKHSRCVIVKRDASCDLIDPVTGRWQVFPTQRAAKWSATVWSRLSSGFGHVTPSDEDIEYAARTAAERK
jgi:hypothetical protein